MQNEEGVSPIIGVILMVAITVILAAVIAAFVFGMSGQLSKTGKITSVTAKQIDAETVEVTLMGGQDTQKLSGLNVTLTTYGSDHGMTITKEKRFETDESGHIPVGSSVEIAGATLEQDRVVVVASYIDGDEQVVLDTKV